ncbi:MAG: hypothetical protein RL235_82, partial [Chlamydiota bacterium]
QPHSPSFDTPTQFNTNQTIIFEDGLKVTLKKINDSRCKEGVVCVWAGELSPEFAIVIPGRENEQMIILGTTTKPTATSAGYAFTLIDATQANATLRITKSGQVACTMDAKVCPDGSYVGRTGPDCEFAPCPGSQGTCYVGGCSSQICSDQQGVVTTCEYKEEYACYKTAKCERQADGKCGWTQTPELIACLKVQ